MGFWKLILKFWRTEHELSNLSEPGALFEFSNLLLHGHCLSLTLPASLSGFIWLCPKINHKEYITSQEPGWSGVNVNTTMWNLPSLLLRDGKMRKECLPVTLALERLRQGNGELEATEQGPFSKANNYKQEEQQWLLFMNHSLREALGQHLLMNSKQIITVYGKMLPTSLL